MIESYFEQFSGEEIGGGWYGCRDIGNECIVAHIPEDWFRDGEDYDSPHDASRVGYRNGLGSVHWSDVEPDDLYPTAWL